MVEHQRVLHMAGAAADGGRAAAAAISAPRQRADSDAGTGGAVDDDAAIAQRLQGGLKGSLVALAGRCQGRQGSGNSRLAAMALERAADERQTCRSSTGGPAAHLSVLGWMNTAAASRRPQQRPLAKATASGGRPGTPAGR